MHLISESDSLGSVRRWRRHSGSRQLDTWSRQGIWEVTPYNLLTSILRYVQHRTPAKFIDHWHTNR